MSEKLWVEKTHEEYHERNRRDTFTGDHYTGAVKDKAENMARSLSDQVKRNEDGSIKSITRDDKEVYLYRRAQGETVEAYIERVVLSKFPNCHADVVDSFAGSVASVEHKADRDLEVFGSAEDKASFYNQLMQDASGNGEGYISLYGDAAARFTNFCRVWYLVEEDGFKWIDGKHVKNWFYTDGVLSEVLVEEMIDGREDMKEDYPEAEERLRWVHYHRKGYDRYKIERNGKGERQVMRIEEESDLWKYPHYDTTETDSPITVPIGFIDLPIDRHPGYKMAQDANYLYNLLSDVRNLLRIANHPKLAGEVTDDEFDNTALSLQQGSNLLQGKWMYTSPSIENAQGGYEIVKEEIRDFYITNHKRYNDVVRDRTATEARQEDQRGSQSWLNTLTTGLDKLENRVLFLLAQKRFPTERSKWLEPETHRSRDFRPVDAKERADMLANRYIEGIVDVGQTGRENVVKEIARLDGVVYEDDELTQVVSDDELERRQEEAFTREASEIQDLIDSTVNA